VQKGKIMEKYTNQRAVGAVILVLAITGSLFLCTNYYMQRKQELQESRCMSNVDPCRFGIPAFMQHLRKIETKDWELIANDCLKTAAVGTSIYIFEDGTVLIDGLVPGHYRMTRLMSCCKDEIIDLYTIVKAQLEELEMKSIVERSKKKIFSFRREDTGGLLKIDKEEGVR